MKYKTKSQIVEAVQWDGRLQTLEILATCKDWSFRFENNEFIRAKNKSDNRGCIELKIGRGDIVPWEYFIIKRGEDIFSISAEDFEKTYEPVEEE